MESKEHLASFYIINADYLDAALARATRTAAIIGMPIELRPFWETSYGYHGDRPWATE